MGRRRGEGISVLLVTPKYPPYMGGAATDYYHLVESLRGSIEFTVLTSAHRGSPLLERMPGARVLRILPPLFDRSAPLRFLLVPLTFMGALLASIKRRHDVIHAHSTTSVGLGALIFGAMTNQPLVKEFTDQGVRDVVVKIRRRSIYLARGQTVMDLLSAKGVPRESIHQVPSLNVPIAKPAEPSPRAAANGGYKAKIEILFAGSLNCRVKGVDVLLEAFKRVAEEEEEVHLSLVGEGPDGERLRKIAQRDGLSSRVSFLGNLSYEGVLEAISHCDLLVLPSRLGEAYPRVIVEAFQFKKPVISTKVGDIPLILGQGKAGLLTDPGDVGGLVRAMRRLVSDAELRRTLGEAGHESLGGLPSWEKFSAEVAGLYMMAVGQGGQSLAPPSVLTNPGRS